MEGHAGTAEMGRLRSFNIPRGQPPNTRIGAKCGKRLA